MRFDEENEQGWIDDDYDEPFECHTCRGTGLVNELTAPKGFLCLGTMECPHCEGTGEIQ